MFREIISVTANEGIELEDIASANSHLLKYQFVFNSGNATDKKVFNLVSSHAGVFENIFSLLGFTLVIDNEYSYVGYVPNKKRYFQIPRDQTNLLLVLRVIYHRERIAGNSEDGLVLITGHQLIEVYKDLIGKDDINDNLSSFESFLKPVREKRIIRMGSERDTDSNVPNITIMPSIQYVVNEEFAIGVIEQIAQANAEQGGLQ